MLQQDAGVMAIVAILVLLFFCGGHNQEPVGCDWPIPETWGYGSSISPSFSPDNRSIAFVCDYAGNRDIWINRIKSGLYPQVQVTTSQEDENSPTWSPDGRFLAYVRGKSGDRSIWLCSAERRGGAQAVCLLPADEQFCYLDPMFDPEGGIICIAEDKRDVGMSDFLYRLIRINRDRTTQILLEVRGVILSQPRPTVEGIYFTSYQPTVCPPRPEVCYWERASGQQRVVTPDPEAGFSAATASPNGRWLACVGHGDGKQVQIWDRQTNLLKMSVPGEGMSLCPTWSADSKQLAYSQQTDQVRPSGQGKISDIFIYRLPAGF